jgi:hypothetical protein
MKKFFMAMVLAAALTCAVVALRRRGCCGGEAESGEDGCTCGCETSA